MRHPRKKYEEAFIQLVMFFGIAKSQRLVDATAHALRRTQHNERERPKFHERRAKARGGKPGKRKGFAVMDPRRVCEISSLGGKAAHAQGTAHEYSSSEAALAGRKGGLVTGEARRQARRRRRSR